MRVQRNERFDKSLEDLKKGDARAILAARNTEAIIRTLTTSEDLSPLENKITWHGEARLEKSLKFDLGSGYRLVSVRDGDTLLMLMVGSHDDCDRWLERNRGTTFQQAETMEAAEPTRETTAAPQEETTEENDADEYGSELSQKELRAIFRGLWG